MIVEQIDPYDEAEALGEILHACVLGGSSVNFVVPFSLEEASEYWRGIDGRVVLGARIEGRLMGTVSLVPATQPNQPHRAEVAKMLVHPDARRKGVGKVLMAEVERIAREIGRTLLVLDTEEGNVAEGLYRSMGYVSFGTVPEFALSADGERFVGATFFYKRLT